MKTDMAISADKTGYGKTLSMVALVLRDKMPWNLEEKHYVDRTYSFADGHVSKTYRSPYTRNNITLILCNVSIIDQWVREFENTPLIVGRISNGRELDELISEGDVSDLDVLIVVPSMFNTIVEMYRGDAWKRFIFDEPGHIRVPAMIHVVAGFYWFVTATPELVYNTHFRCNKSYMKTLFREIGSGGDLLNNLSIRNDEKFLEESFVMPQTSHKYYNCFTQMRGIFRGLVHGRIQEMIDADNIEGVIAALGGNQTSNIADLVRKRKLEEQEEISSKVRIYTLRGDDEKVTEWKEKLVSINAQIEMLDSRFKDMLSSDCVICFENLKNPIMEAHCNNIFCGACILKWIAENRTCPMCRWTVEEKELVYIETDPEKKIQKKKKTKKIKTKEETLIKIIKSRPDGKFIIFSMWDGTFSRIVSLLDENKISHIEIKGPAAVIAHRLNMFREGRVQAVLLNTQHNGSGINLQETTDIILYHTMSDHYTAQAIGRANRIGRTIPLTVHHLLYDDESIPE
jgi:SNF2 family DNA or RNA helicase